MLLEKIAATSNAGEAEELLQAHAFEVAPNFYYSPAEGFCQVGFECHLETIELGMRLAREMQLSFAPNWTKLIRFHYGEVVLAFGFEGLAAMPPKWIDRNRAVPVRDKAFMDGIRRLYDRGFVLPDAIDSSVCHVAPNGDVLVLDWCRFRPVQNGDSRPFASSADAPAAR